ncbi:MAG: hypothetical protein Q8P20_07680 [bacterium]|nr:hypothetical protein [bacterium]
MIIWFRSGLIIGGGEEGIVFYNTEKTLLLSTSVWVEYATGASTIGWLSKAPIVYLSTIFEKIGIPLFIFQAALFYVLILVGISSVFYLISGLLEKDKNSRTIALISAIFYLFNPFVFSQIWGRSIYAQYFSFAFLPLSLLLFHLGIRDKKYFFGFLIALISSVMATAYGFLTFIVVYWLVLFIYFLFHVLNSKNKTNEAFFGIKFIFFTFVLWCFFNSWWFVPLLSSLGNVNNVNIPRFEESLQTLLGVSKSFPLDVIIRLLQKGYFFDATAYSQVYSTLPFQLISFIPLCFVLVGLIKTIRNKEFVKFRFFVVLLILGLVVSLGANPPFGWLFVWLFKHITPLQAFRNPFEKFGLVYALGYCAVFAFGLVNFFENKRFKNLAMLVVLVLTCGIYAWPMWTGRVIAGFDKKIGLDIPVYYKDLRNWLANQGGDYRLFMTPVSSGDGAFYQWNEAARYQGADPMVFMLDQPVISNSAHIPLYYDFITNIRQYMEREDLAPALSLLRAKFLIDRKDAIFVSEGEREQYKFLTSVIYPPKGVESNLKAICQNMTADSKSNGVVWIVCHIPSGDDNLSKIRYLHIKVKTDAPAHLVVGLTDTNGIGNRWYGRSYPYFYDTDVGDWQEVIIPISNPTEDNTAIDLSKSATIEVQANSKDHPEKSVGEINISEIKLDPGIEKPINEFKKVAEFGKLAVFEPVNFNSSPEFGNLFSVDYVSDFVQLFDEVNQKRNILDKKGFILTSQNTQKNLQDLPNETSLQVTEKYKISDTRYWLKVREGSGGGLLLLSKTFDPQWKLIAGMSKEKLSGNFFDDLKLLKVAVLPEDNHYIVNGYANLWKVDDKDSEYAIVFMPQIIADIASKVSIFSLFLIVGFITLNIFISVRRNRSGNSI